MRWRWDVFNGSERGMALTAASGLLLMAVLAPFANFYVLDRLVVPGEAAATASKIMAAVGLFRAAIAAFLVVFTVDVVVAWALYVLLRPVDRTLALLTAWLRVVFAAVSVGATANLFKVLQTLSEERSAAAITEHVAADAMRSIDAFRSTWEMALAIFGVHLLGLGWLLIRSKLFPKVLGALVVVAGLGYLTDSLGTVLIQDYSLAVSTYTFIGEALLIPWLFWSAAKTPAGTSTERAVMVTSGMGGRS